MKYILLIFIIILFLLSIKQIPYNNVLIIERFGKYNRTAKKITFLIPFIDKIYATVNLNLCTIYVYLKDFHSINNVTLKINTTIHYLVKEPAKFAYEAKQLYETIDELTRALILEIITPMDSTTIFHSKKFIIECLNKNLDKVFENLGCDLALVKLNLRTIKNYNHTIHTVYHATNHFPINNLNRNIFTPQHTTASFDTEELEKKLELLTNDVIKSTQKSSTIGITQNSDENYSLSTEPIIENLDENYSLSTEPIIENSDDTDASPITKY